LAVPHSDVDILCATISRCGRASAGHLGVEHTFSSSSAPSFPGAMSELPESGQRILIFKPGLIEQIVAGTKTMEIRGVHYKPGFYLLGSKGVVHASARLGPAVLIESPLQFERHHHRHRYPFGSRNKLPYKTTWGFPISDVKKMNLPFRHPQGAVSMVRYQKP